VGGRRLLWVLPASLSGQRQRCWRTNSRTKIRLEIAIDRPLAEISAAVEQALGRPAERGPQLDFVVLERITGVSVDVQARERANGPLLSAHYKLLSDAGGGSRCEALYAYADPPARGLLGTVTALTADNRPLLEWAKADVRAVGTAIGEAERERLARERSSAAADAPQPRLKVKVEAKITPA